MARKTSINNTKKATGGYLGKLETDIQSKQSKVSLVLGALIVLVVGVLVFNYFNKNKASLGPAQQTETQTPQEQPADVAKENLPGSYTVKEGDTLFLIAQKYYDDGDKFSEIAKANNLADVDQITAGQVLQIPKSEPVLTLASPQPTASPEAEDQGTGTGGGNTTIWGPRIEGNTYTVMEDDWLSKIAGRAYGDIMAFQKIAQANNIADPDHIEPGQVLVIPR